MAEEKKEESNVLSEALSKGLVFAIIGAVGGFLLSIFAFVDVGFLGLSTMAILGLGGAAFGFCLGFIYGIFPKNMKAVGAVVVIIILGLVIYWVIISATFGVGPLAPYLSSLGVRFRAIGDFFSDFKQYGYCLSADERCPFIAMWETPDIQNQEEYVRVDLSFSNKRIINNEINLLAKLKVFNPEEDIITIAPKCFVGLDKQEQLEFKNPGSYCRYNECNFPNSDYEMQTSFVCYGTTDKTSETVYVVLERPVIVRTVWPIKVKNVVLPEDYENPIVSEMDYNAPYTIALASANQVPFEQGKEYNFEIIIKRKERDVELKKLNSLTITSLTGIMMQCNGFDGDSINNLDREQLKQVAQYTELNDEFRFLCTLYVAEAPDRATRAPVSLQAEYIVESEYKAIVTKQI